jgi:hypothetical protein
MAHKEIEIVIDEKGAVEIEAKGYKGDACLDATKSFEEALGVVSKRKRKPEGKQVKKEVKA